MRFATPNTNGRILGGIFSKPSRRHALARTHQLYLFSLIIVPLPAVSVTAQSTASIEGQVKDQNNATVSGVEITAICSELAVSRITYTDDGGRYQLPALPVGTYNIEVRSASFQTQLVKNLTLEVGRRITQNFQLRVGDVSHVVNVSGDGFIEMTTTAVGSVMDRRMVQQLPLNGRYFLVLGLLVPGSVTAPQGAFSSAQIRGLGSFAFTTAGNRDETTNYIINGITLNNLTNSSITFQPSIGTVQEFKVDNSTFSAEHGQSSGAIVNIATRSGANEFHGEAFEFFRNDALDARNYFTFT